MNWRPTAELAQLRARAHLLQTLRQFFADRGVLEVETPLLCDSGVTDPAIETLQVTTSDALSAARHLQTSPEYAMKRLLAAGSGPIYQVARAFRDGEAGARHNPEFTLLEWYRPGYDYHQLMTEVAELVRICLGEIPQRRVTYRQLFMDILQLDPFVASVEELSATARRHLDPGGMAGDRDLWLDLLMSHVIEPQLAEVGMCFVYDYPASQAALSVVEKEDDALVARRFELYVRGFELANGYYELTDAAEQRRRFLHDNSLRRERGQAERPLDARLLAALEHGLPAGSGVALGVDRLLMLSTDTDDIRQVLAFDWDSA